jgi:hypothetical protein
MMPNTLSSALLMASSCVMLFPTVSATCQHPVAFLPRQEPSATIPAFQGSFSAAELEAFNCIHDDEQDYQARFAKQYKSEREAMMMTESGYLLLHNHRDQVVPAALKTVSSAPFVFL